jgi:DNA-directed RNA polymerase subunit beta'
MLQEAVDSLLDNGRRGKAMTGANKRAQVAGRHDQGQERSLPSEPAGQARGLLGPFGDHRGPTLKLHQCGLPKLMALELFKPFIFRAWRPWASPPPSRRPRRKSNPARPWCGTSWKRSSRNTRSCSTAPTLHRLGIQAFEPILIEGKAIQLHPLVCAAFNADFDGDQMAVHVPLSVEAQMEARTLMLASNNVLFPASGEPSIVPRRTWCWACTTPPATASTARARHGVFRRGRGAARAGRRRGRADAKISVRLTEWTKDKATASSCQTSLVDTTVGRALLSEILPKGLPFQQHEQGAEEEGNLADQRLLPQVRPEGHRGVRRQAAAKRLPPGHARGHLDRHRRHAGAPQKPAIIERAEKK